MYRSIFSENFENERPQDDLPDDCQLLENLANDPSTFSVNFENERSQDDLPYGYPRLTLPHITVTDMTEKQPNHLSR